MEAQDKLNFNGPSSSNEAEKHDENEVGIKLVKPRSSDLFLRVLAGVTTVVAATVVGMAKDTELVSVPITSTLSLKVAATARIKYTSGGVYFLVCNAIACAYAASSLVLLLLLSVYKWCKARWKGLELTITIFDLIAVSLLFSGNGAAAALGVIAYEGNSHVHWNKLCNIFHIYCRHLVASILVSLLGSFLFMTLVVRAIFKLQRRCNYPN